MLDCGAIQPGSVDVLGPIRVDIASPEGAATAGSGRPKALPRKEVIQPQLPLRLPCYDLALLTSFTLGVSLLAVR